MWSPHSFLSHLSRQSGFHSIFYVDLSPPIRDQTSSLSHLLPRMARKLPTVGLFFLSFAGLFPTRQCAPSLSSEVLSLSTMEEKRSTPHNKAVSVFWPNNLCSLNLHSLSMWPGHDELSVHPCRLYSMANTEFWKHQIWKTLSMLNNHLRTFRIQLKYLHFHKAVR